MQVVSVNDYNEMNHTRYALRDKNGQWVHFSLEQYDDGAWRLTEVDAWRWTPTEAQLTRARDKYPSLRTFRAVPLPGRARQIPV